MQWLLTIVIVLFYAVIALVRPGLRDSARAWKILSGEIIVLIGLNPFDLNISMGWRILYIIFGGVIVIYWICQTPRSRQTFDGNQRDGDKKK